MPKPKSSYKRQSSYQRPSGVWIEIKTEEAYQKLKAAAKANVCTIGQWTGRAVRYALTGEAYIPTYRHTGPATATKRARGFRLSDMTWAWVDSRHGEDNARAGSHEPFCPWLRSRSNASVEFRPNSNSPRSGKVSDRLSGVALYKLNDPSPEAKACYRRLLCSPDPAIIRQAEADLGMTRQEYADRCFDFTVRDGFRCYTLCIDWTTPAGRLACVRFFLGSLMVVEAQGYDSCFSHEGSAERSYAMQAFPALFAPEISKEERKRLDEYQRLSDTK